LSIKTACPCAQALLQEVDDQAGADKWSLAGSFGNALPPGRACAQQAVVRIAGAGNNTLLASVRISNNLKVRRCAVRDLHDCEDWSAVSSMFAQIMTAGMMHPL